MRRCCERTAALGTTTHTYADPGGYVATLTLSGGMTITLSPPSDDADALEPAPEAYPLFTKAASTSMWWCWRTAPAPWCRGW
ncbi:hypothetical protein LIP_2847 [Limnochorda pilosa]|uniref:Uncharacterized protein n=1 Tax=Limnochorda pilosa TaxID=1555112 RepID=A0A0K2SNK5_LIMPI|nr:hypothetical protein LIP_2847 [Limnochorda pilosa]